MAIRTMEEQYFIISYKEIIQPLQIFFYPSEYPSPYKFCGISKKLLTKFYHLIVKSRPSWTTWE